MRRHYTWKEVLVVFAFYMTPPAVAFGLVLSVPATLVVLGAAATAVLRRAATEELAGTVRRRLRNGY